MDAAIDVSPLVPYTNSGSAKPGSLQRTVETVDNNELLSITYPPNPTLSIDTLSFSIARLWSCASGFNTSFPSDTPVVEAPPHPGELGAGLSQTWLSARSHCTSLSRRWYEFHRTKAGGKLTIDPIANELEHSRTWTRSLGSEQRRYEGAAS